MIASYVLGRRFAKMTGRFDEETDARNARQLFETLSGMWIKVGQLLSLRTDLLSDPMCRELSALQYQMHGFPSDIAIDVIQTDLGQPIQKIFSSFEVHPIAAASICQVHRAVLRSNNRRVVVKVMRPGVDESFRRDMGWLGSIVWFMRVFGIGSRLRFDEGLRELRSLLSEETNYAFEALHLKVMRPALKSHGIIVPKVFPKVSSSRVLVMEEIPGVLMSAYIRMRRENPRALRRWEVHNGIEPSEIAETLVITTLRQILEENQFHGDLHPGNIMLLCDNRVALIDFGTVGRMETQQWKIYTQMTESLARRDFNRAADYMLMMAPQVPARGVAKLRRELAEIMRHWEARSGIESSSYEECSMASLSTGAAEVMAKYKVPPSWAMMRVGRSLSTLDASLTTLAPDGNFMQLYRAYFKDRAARHHSIKGRIAKAMRGIDEVSTVLADAQVLILPQIRYQALRLRGMADTLSVVRITLLQMLRRAAMTVAGLGVVGWAVDRYAHTLPHDEGNWLLTFIHGIESGLPSMHSLHWVLIILGAWFVAHVFNETYKVMTRRD
jgi:ubiquinone biosynthesis protein